MQLLPSVGKGEAKKLKIRYLVQEQLLSPNVNLRLGTRYLKEIISAITARWSMPWRPITPAPTA